MANTATVTITTDRASGNLNDVFVNTNPSLMLSNFQNYLAGVQSGSDAASIAVKINSGNSVKASKTVSVTSPVSGDSLEINGVAFVAGSDFSIGASDSATATNLANAINASSNALILNILSASASSSTITITSTGYGLQGNLITLEGKGSGGIDPTGSGTHASSTLTCSTVAANDTSIINGVTLTAVDKKEKTQVQAVADVAGSLNSKYFTFFSAGNTTKYYMWYSVNSAGVDPAVSSATGIKVDVATGATASAVASASRAKFALSPLSTNFTESGATDKIVFRCVSTGTTTDTADGAAATGFTITKLVDGGTVGATEFQITGSNTNDATALKNLINAQSSTLATIVIATSSSAVVTVSAIKEGIEGNDITLSATGGISAGTARLAGGTNSSVVRLSGGTEDTGASTYNYQR